MFSLREHDHRYVAAQIPPYKTTGLYPSPFPISSSSVSQLRRATSAHCQGDLRITVRASRSRSFPWASHSSRTSHHLVLPDFAGSLDWAGLSISSEAPADDRMSIPASEDELGSEGDDSAALPPSGRVALPESDPELTAMLSWASESIGLHWRPPLSPECSRLDKWFMGRRPIIGSHLRFHSSRKCIKRKWLGLGGHLFLPETELLYQRDL